MLRPAGNVWPFRIKIARAIVAGLLLLLAGTALATDQQVKSATDRFDQIRAQFDLSDIAIEQAAERPKALLEIRAEIEPLRDELRRFIADLEPVHAQAEVRLKQLGPPPAADQPPETPAVASEREQQSILVRDADAALRQARLLLVRADQIVSGIDERRRAAFTNRLFERSDSFFAPAGWLAAGHALAPEWESLRGLLAEWRDHVSSRAGTANLLLAVSLALAAIVALFLLRKWIRSRVASRAPVGEVGLLPRSHKAVLAVREALLNALTAPAASLAVLEIFAAFGLLPDPIRPIANSLVLAIAFFSVGNALALAVLAPNDSPRRLPDFDDETARTLYWLIARSVAVTSLAVFVNALYRALSTSVSLTILTSAAFAFLIALFIVLALLKSRPVTADREAGGVPPWVRLAGWLAAIAIFVSLATGYIRFASLVADRFVKAAIVLIALALLLALIDAILGEGLKSDSPRRRAFAATLGLRPKTVDVFGALLAGLLRALLVLAAIFLVLGTLTTSTIDLSSTFDSSTLALQIGGTRIQFADIVAAVVILLVGIAVTRIFYRWLWRDVLPRTDIEASLQNSVATIAGYVGVIVAVALALARLGVNLENIALVAGALSIGIGFGLQSIVSNFVSGLILLTERPIRVGDWIVVGNEQGYVRKISVRSTEIETFDRASVIVPNSDLISGVVKNWTHFNKLGRFAVPVGVSYDSDPQAVRDLLLEIAAKHPLVLETPAPAVFFLDFGDSSLQLDLRGFVADINQGFGVRSDLHFEIFRRFREAGIEIPYPQRDIHIRTAPGAEPVAEPESAPKRRR